MSFHISPRTGNPNRCYATTRPCPIGGAHFPTKEEARTAFENEQENTSATTLTGVTKLTLVHNNPFDPALEEAFKARVTPHLPGSYQLTKSQLAALTGLANGKPVKAKVLDEIIDRLRHIATPDLYNERTECYANLPVLKYLREVRKQDPTPNTFPSAQSFDPSKQSIFASDKARQDPHFAVTAIRREEAHRVWCEELGTKTADLLISAKDEQEAQNIKNTYAHHFEEADRAAVNVTLQLKELQWLMDNEPNFKGKGTLAFIGSLKRVRKDDRFLENSATKVYRPLRTL